MSVLRTSGSFSRAFALVATTVVSTLLASAAPLAAQRVDARWRPFLGCWSAGTSAPRNLDGSPTAANAICVAPATSGSGVEISTIADGKTTQSDPLVASGAQVRRTRDGCDGWEMATWSQDAHRVLLRSEFTCPGGDVRRSSGILGFSPAAEFLQVHGISVGGKQAVRVATFPALESDSVSFALSTARFAAAAPIRLDDVLEVASAVDRTVTEAWLSDLGQPFTLDAPSLIKLADAGLEPRVIDLMVALSNPKAFVVRKSTDGMVGGVDAAPSRALAQSGRRGAMPVDAYGNMLMDFGMMGAGFGFPLSYFDMMRLGLYGNGFGRNAFFNNGLFGNAFLGNGFFGNGFWGNGFNGGFNGGFYAGNAPVTIVPRAEVEAQGRAINGGGYTRPSSGRSSRDAYPTSSGRADSQGGYSGGSSSSSSAGSPTGSGASGGSSGGGGRTAQPRPPGN